MPLRQGARNVTLSKHAPSDQFNTNLKNKENCYSPIILLRLTRTVFVNANAERQRQDMEQHI